MTDVSDQVNQAVARVAKRDAGTIEGTARLAEDLGVRSLNRIELAAILEDAMGITLEDVDVLRAKTVDDLVAVVESSTNATGERR